MEDGSVLTVPAGEVQILNGTVFVSDSFLIAQGLTASSNNTVLLLALGAAGVAVAANALESSSDSDDNVAPPVATPPPAPPPMPPVFTSSATAGVAENQTDAYRAVATDADSDTLSYSLSGTDASRFMIDATTGEVRFIEAPDFEAPGDADMDNVYDIIVTASDGANTAERTVAIMVTDENEAPIFTSDAAVSVAENQTAAYAALATDADGDTLSYTLSGTDAALFMIDGATGEVRFIEAPDFENPGDADGDNVYDIVVTASDGTSSTDQAVAITVTDETDSTAFQRLLDNPRGASVADFEAAGIERVNVLTLDATRELLQAVGENDPETLASLTPQQVQAITDIARDHIVSISGPEDAGIYDSGEFTLGSNPAIVSVEAGSFIAALDYDGDGETDHIVTIEFDADYRVQRVERDFGANNEADDPPDAVEVVERPDDRTVQITYDIQGDGDTDRVETYTLDENGDRIRIDVDTDADGSTDRVESYEVDAGGNRIQIDFDDNADGEIDRTESDDDADDNPDRIETYTFDDNGNRNRIRTDFDNDSDGTIDRAEFDDNADGATDRSEIYTYDASDNRIRTDFDDNNDGAIDRIETYTLDANGNRVRTDLEDNNDGIIDRIETYTLDASGNRVRTNSDDNADGNIDRVEFDDDADGAADRSETYIYDASGNRVRTDFDDNNDGTVDRVDFQDNTPIDNTPIDNTPIFSSAAAVRVAENQTEAYTAVATHADGNPLSYSLSGTDAALFTIDPTTGAVRFIASPDFENPDDAGGDNVYNITVTASDDDNSTDHDVAITVTNINDNTPSFTSPDSANVAENETLAYTAVATDADGDDLTYSLSGTDAARFTINPVTGAVSFMEAPDFENPDDAGGDNVYNITVTASDDTNESNHDVAITVTNENDNDPIFNSGNSAGVVENQNVDSVVYTAIASDADGDTLTYRLSGTDASLFTIDPTTGDIRFITVPDVEAPGDANRDNVYEITVTASDDTNDIAQAVAITVTNVNEDAPSFTSPDSASVAENQTVAYTAAATDADGDPLMYSLSGTDADLFTIDPATGVVSFITPPDFEDPGDAGSNNIYNITVTASDGDNSTNHNVAITVTNENDNDPSFTSDASASVAENQTAAYAAIAADADGDDLSYSLSGTDAALFTIDPTTGVVSFIAPPDFEDPDDAGGNNVYDITVTASDDDNSTDHDVAITVTNENDNTPSFTSPDSVDVAEDETLAYTAAATDADGDDLSYSLSGTDAALFTIDSNTGAVSFIASPDFEDPGDAGRDNVYNITVTASDDTNESNHDVTITVTNENDNDPIFNSGNSAGVAENQNVDSVVYTAMATDADGDTLSYSLSGADASRFTIDPNTGAVRFIASPDFENPGDAGGDNVYDITVMASDDDNSTDHDVAITVTNENDNTPSFTSPDSANVAENETLAYTAVATDADGDDLSYSLSGTDAALFTINLATGEVRFRAAPDFEDPGDAGRDNVYNITVTASDDTNESNHDVTITVTNENDSDPIFNSGNSAGVVENQNVDNVVYTAMATDADGDTLSYSLSGTDAALFTIDPTTGAVRFTAAPDFENPGDDDDDNVYDITVTVSDGMNSADHAVAITVTNENDNTPSFTSGASVSVMENQSADSVFYTAQATDEDGDALTYSLSGTDAARFTIDPATGEVRFIAAPDFENPGDDDDDNVYDITVTASDGAAANDVDQTVAITVTNENDNTPVFSSPASAEVAENQSAETVVYTAAATDADGDTLGYSLSGTDAGLFTIDATTGAVSFVAPPDFENPGDDDGDNVYDIIVTASDGRGESAEQPVAITVTARAPILTSPFDLSLLDGTNGFTLAGIDAGDRSGTSVSSAGDVNGDGYDDLIIGAYRADPNGDSGAGETYVVYGGAVAPGTDGVLDLSTLDGTNGFALTGIDAGDNSGRSVSSAGDLNGDGYDDLIIGALYADPNGDNSGETYVVYGGAGENGVLDLSTLDGSNGFTLTGIDAGDLSGTSVSSAGDVNGDGYDDLIIGVYELERIGLAYVVYGGATGTESLVPVTAQGTAAADNFTGNAGADSFTAISTNDVVRGGPGDDIISVTALDFADIDGGTGADSLALTGSNLSLDLTGAGNAGVASVEVFDLSGTGSNTLVLDALAVFDLTEERADAIATLDVLGNSDDTVDLSNSNFTPNGTATEDGTTYAVYRDGNAHLRVEDGVTVMLRTDFDDDNDGTTDRSEAYSYANGNLTRTDFDDDNDGTTDRSEAYSYTNGNLTRTDFDDDNDGTTDRSEYDDDGDGTTDRVETYIYTNGNLTRTNFDVDNDGTTDRVETYSFSANGDRTRTDFDDNNDGTIDRTEAYFYDANGNLTRTDFDDNADGNINQVDFDDDGDGTTDRAEIYTYDVNGNLTRINFDDDSDGTTDRSESYSYDANGNLTRTDFDDDGDGTTDRTVFEDDGTIDRTITSGVALSLLDGSNGFTLTGINPHEDSGSSVSSAGDVNGDGYDDLIIGASLADPNGEYSGETYVVYGGASIPVDGNGEFALASLNGGNGFTLTGIDEEDLSGGSVSSAGDVNGDGYDDLIIGAIYADPDGNSYAGETYVVYGGASIPVDRRGEFALSSLNGGNGFTLTGIDEEDLSGGSVSSAGDVNGDGYDDLIIGAGRPEWEQLRWRDLCRLWRGEHTGRREWRVRPSRPERQQRLHPDRD